MPLIVNLRGTSGSGKSTVARTFIETCHHELLMGTAEPPKKPKPEIKGVRVEVPRLSAPLFLIGKYDNACGGMDGISTQQQQADRILAARKHGHVLCEGLLLSSVSHEATVPAALLAAYGRDGVCFAFLDTPLEVCLDRVRHRRELAGNLKPFNEENTRKKWEDTFAAKSRLEAAGYWTELIDHTKAFHQVYHLFKDHP